MTLIKKTKFARIVSLLKGLQFNKSNNIININKSFEISPNIPKTNNIITVTKLFNVT